MKIPPHWQKTFKWFDKIYIIYIFGFVINFRPTNPYIHDLLSQQITNSTEEIITQEVSSLFIYSAAIQSILVFILTDFLSYNPIITISAFSGIAATSLSIWQTAFFHVQIAEILYGTVLATEIAYFASIYANADIKNYQKLTSHVRAAPLLANAASAFLAQCLIENHYEKFYCVNLASYTLALILSIFLPPSEDNVYNRKPEKEQRRILFNLQLLAMNFLKSFANKYVIKYCIWSSLTMCSFYKISLTLQPFWRTIYSTNPLVIRPDNGLFYSVSFLLGLFAVLLAGVSNFDWRLKGDLILSLTSILQAFLLIFMSQADNLFINSLFFSMYVAFYYFALTLVTAEIAKNLDKGCFGLVFGFNNLLALSATSALTFLLNGSEFVYKYQLQIMICGYYNLVVSVIFLTVGITYWFAQHTYQ